MRGNSTADQCRLSSDDLENNANCLLFKAPMAHGSKCWDIWIRWFEQLEWHLLVKNLDIVLDYITKNTIFFLTRIIILEKKHLNVAVLITNLYALSTVCVSINKLTKTWFIEVRSSNFIANLADLSERCGHIGQYSKY